jgi:FKBP-type peptidyl-prolyl cis-trans isomerase FkpA
MRTKISMLIAVSFMLASCGVDYKKTKSGLVYKIISGGSKDSVAGKTDKIKLHFVQKLNDSVLYSSYGKMPRYQDWTDDQRISYSPLEVLFMMKEGDSAISIQSMDTLLNKGMQQQFPYAKKGDQIKTYIKVVKIFRDDSLFRADLNAEMAKDKPRQEAEQKEMQAKQEVEQKKYMEEMKKQKALDIEEFRKNGEIAKEEKQVEAYLATKKINARKVEGTWVVVKDKGTGAPAATGKVVTVKYAGRLLKDDKPFEASEYIFELGAGQAIDGWDQGIPEFNKGGKGTLFVPAYLAYGKNPGPGGTPFESLIFEIEILNVSNSREEAYAAKQVADSLAAAKNPAKTK